MAAGTTQLIDVFESFLSAEDRKGYTDVLGIFRGRGAHLDSDDALVMEGRLLLDWAERHVPLYFTPEQRIEMDMQFLHFFKGLAEKGDLYSMRYVAFAYERGVERQNVIRCDGGWRISSVPDYEKAMFWCRRAADAGDDVARGALPQIARDAAAQRSGLPAPEAPVAPPTPLPSLPPAP